MMTKSAAGWLILVFALSVPGVLCYQWYAHLDKTRKQGLTLKVRSRIPDGGPFASSPNTNKLVNPMAAPSVEGEEEQPPSSEGLGNDVAEPMSAALSGEGKRPSSEEKPPLSNTDVPLAASIAAVSTAPMKPVEAPKAPAEPAPAPETPAAPAAETFLAWRDPTLSPYDRIRLERTETEKQLRLREVKDKLAREKRPKAKKEPDFEKAIVLQGIVSSPEGGNRAIVNGEAVREGDMIGSVKVLRITQQGVIFSHKGRRFTRSVNR